MRRAMAWTMSALTMVTTVAVAARDTDAAGDRFPRDLYRLDAHALGLTGSALDDRWWVCRFSSDRQDLPAEDGCATLWGRPPAFVALPRATRVVAAAGAAVAAARLPAGQPPARRPRPADASAAVAQERPTAVDRPAGAGVSGAGTSGTGAAAPVRRGHADASTATASRTPDHRDRPRCKHGCTKPKGKKPDTPTDPPKRRKRAAPPPELPPPAAPRWRAPLGPPPYPRVHQPTYCASRPDWLMWMEGYGMERWHPACRYEPWPSYWYGPPAPIDWR